MGWDRNEELEPPLADSLFENRLAFSNILDGIPHIGAIAATLRDRISGGKALEDELAELDAAARSDARAAQQLMAVRFYLQRVTAMCGDAWRLQAHGAINYHVLVDSMVRWSTHAKEPVLFVTFNYDTMLEKAIEQELTYTIREIGSYVARNDVKVFKLHGSVDWGHRGHSETLNLTTMQNVIEHASELEVPDTFEIKRDWASGRGGEYWVPALAVPVRRKPDFECPSDHLDLFEQLLRTVDRVLVIGWAAMEQHFLAKLSERLRVDQRAVVVACGSADAARETWGRLNQLPGATVRNGRLWLG